MRISGVEPEWTAYLSGYCLGISRLRAIYPIILASTNFATFPLKNLPIFADQEDKHIHRCRTIVAMPMGIYRRTVIGLSQLDHMNTMTCKWVPDSQLNSYRGGIKYSNQINRRLTLHGILYTGIIGLKYKAKLLHQSDSFEQTLEARTSRLVSRSEERRVGKEC